MKTQYGVRKGHSTSHAVFPARRFQNLAEVSGKPISIVLLDWEKAFDRIDHGRLLESMRRLKIPTNIYNIISDIYANPKFTVSADEGTSDFFIQQSVSDRVAHSPLTYSF